MQRAALLILTLLTTLTYSDNSAASSADGFGADPFGTITSAADLPGDFPRELIPDAYDAMSYTDMTSIGGIAGASFESKAPVNDAIAYYTKLLGEPDVAMPEEADGQRMVLWKTTPHPPWTIGIMGGSQDTAVAISKPTSN